MDWELLDRYLAGGCTIAERAYVQRWLGESPVRRQLLEQLTAPDPSASAARKADVRARLESALRAELKTGGNGA